MPGWIFSWEEEEYLVQEYAALADRGGRVPANPMHIADVCVAIALQQKTLAGASEAERARHRHAHILHAKRVLDSLPIIAMEELNKHGKFVLPGIAQLKVKKLKDNRPRTNQSSPAAWERKLGLKQ